MFGKQSTTEKFSRLEFSTDEAELRALRVMTEANDTMLKLKQITPDEHHSESAPARARYAELDLGAVARSIAASARGILPSGRPSISALSTHAFTMGIAMG